MPAPSEPESSLDAPGAEALPTATDTPPPRAEAPPATPTAPSVERVEAGPTAPVPADPPPAPHPPTADLQRQTITIVIQLQPADGDPAGRPVLVSVRAGQSAPLFAAPLRYSALGPLPGLVTALLQHLQLRTLSNSERGTRNADSRAAPPAASRPTSAFRAPTSVAPPAPAPPTDPASTQLTLF